MTYTLRPRANFSAGKFIAFARGELARRREECREFGSPCQRSSAGTMTGLFRLTVGSYNKYRPRAEKKMRRRAPTESKKINDQTELQAKCSLDRCSHPAVHRPTTESGSDTTEPYLNFDMYL